MNLTFKDQPIICGPFYSYQGRVVRFSGGGQGMVFGEDAAGKRIIIPNAASPDLILLDIKEWPHLALSDPRLPYEFDLHWDCKCPSDILRELPLRDPATQEEILALVRTYNKLKQLPAWTPSTVCGPYARLLRKAKLLAAY